MKIKKNSNKQMVNDAFSYQSANFYYINVLTFSLVLFLFLHNKSEENLLAEIEVRGVNGNVIIIINHCGASTLA